VSLIAVEKLSDFPVVYQKLAFILPKLAAEDQVGMAI
jgi:hypothetical protein